MTVVHSRIVTAVHSHTVTVVHNHTVTAVHNRTVTAAADSHKAVPADSRCIVAVAADKAVHPSPVVRHWVRLAVQRTDYSPDPVQPAVQAVLLLFLLGFPLLQNQNHHQQKNHRNLLLLQADFLVLYSLPGAELLPLFLLQSLLPERL